MYTGNNQNATGKKWWIPRYWVRMNKKKVTTAAARQNAEPSRAIRADEVVLVVLPLFHIFGLTVGIGAALANGGSVVLVERFDPSSALETVGRHGVTIIPGAPAMWAAWANLPDASPDALASVRLALSGSDKLPAAVAEAVEARFGVVVHEAATVGLPLIKIVLFPARAMGRGGNWTLIGAAMIVGLMMALWFGVQSFSDPAPSGKSAAASDQTDAAAEQQAAAILKVLLPHG